MRTIHHSVVQLERKIDRLKRNEDAIEYNILQEQVYDFSSVRNGELSTRTPGKVAPLRATLSLAVNDVRTNGSSAMAGPAPLGRPRQSLKYRRVLFSFQITRTSLTGLQRGPSVGEIIEILGAASCVRRLDAVLAAPDSNSSWWHRHPSSITVKHRNNRSSVPWNHKNVTFVRRETTISVRVPLRVEIDSAAPNCIGWNWVLLNFLWVVLLFLLTVSVVFFICGATLASRSAHVRH